jgi:hypothetical protein
MLPRLLAPARSPGKHTEAEAAVRDEGAHPELGGERHGLMVPALGFLALGGLPMGANLALEPQGIRLIPSLLMRPGGSRADTSDMAS